MCRMREARGRRSVGFVRNLDEKAASALVLFTRPSQARNRTQIRSQPPRRSGTTGTRDVLLCALSFKLPFLCRTVLQQLTPGPTHARCTYPPRRTAAMGTYTLPVPRCVVRARHSSRGVLCCSSSDSARATGKTSLPRSVSRVSPRDTSRSTLQLGSWHMTTTSS